MTSTGCRRAWRSVSGSPSTAIKVGGEPGGEPAGLSGEPDARRRVDRGELDDPPVREAQLGVHLERADDAVEPDAGHPGVGAEHDRDAVRDHPREPPRHPQCSMLLTPAVTQSTIGAVPWDLDDVGARPGQLADAPADLVRTVDDAAEEQQCPPGGVRGAPAARRGGPLRVPAVISSRRVNASPCRSPRSRTVVTPASSAIAARAAIASRRTSGGSVCAAPKGSGLASAMRCTCALTNPGSSVAPGRWCFVTPSARRSCREPTATIRSPRTSTASPGQGRSGRTASTRSPLIRTSSVNCCWSPPRTW